MILKENFDPRKVVPYVWRELTVSAVTASAAYALVEIAQVKQAALPFAPIAMLGTAMAILLAFRNNTSYSRWWEASTLWQTIHTQSRIFARLVVTFVDSHKHTPAYDPTRAANFQRSMINRQIAWANVLRLSLRGQKDWREVQAYLSDDEYQTLLKQENKPGYLMLQHGKSIYDAMANGTLQGFDSFQLENALAQLTAQEGLAKRLKTTPVPRQYDYFTRLFVYLLILLLPFGLLSILPGGQAWLAIPFAVLLSFVFAILERIGAVNEHPFENRITDVPLTAICRNIERDLLATLGQEQLPPALTPQDGYLF
jgi:putative membrane protein